MTGQSGPKVDGVVMAAFGQTYVALAYRAAESLKQHNPGLEVDLFTDTDRDRGPFSRIHVLQDVWIRSKVDAMLQSRFDRTLYLDADLYVLSDLGDVFDVLDRFDIAAVQDQYRNSIPARRTFRDSLGNAFPQVNSGVLGFRKSDAVTEFLQDWKREVQVHGIGKDQPSLRELLWKKDIRLAVLPPEYNLWDYPSVDRLSPEFHAAPRILHSSIFRGRPLPPPGADVLAHYFGRARAYKIGLLLAADEALAQRRGHPALSPTRGQRNKLRWLYALAYAARYKRAFMRLIKAPVPAPKSTD